MKKLSGYIELSESVYNSDLLLAFSDFITDDSLEHNKSELIACIKSRLEEDIIDLELDTQTIEQAFLDIKHLVTEYINNLYE